KVAATNRTQTEHIEIIRRHSATEQLHSVTKSRQRERKHVFGSEILTHCLTSAKMLKPRQRQRKVDQLAIRRIGKEVHNAPRFFERKAPQEQIVDQTEECGVRANRERECDYGDDGESWRFGQGPECVFEVGDHKIFVIFVR